MLCQQCKQNQATVHMQQVINGEMTELYLCPGCASTAEMTVSFDKFFQGFLDSIMPGQTAAAPRSYQNEQCPVCGMTYNGLRTTGRFGCADCYRTFHKEIEAILKNVQGSNDYVGKVPVHNRPAISRQKLLENWRKELEAAIAREEYESAALIRDKIRQLEAEGEETQG